MGVPDEAKETGRFEFVYSEKYKLSPKIFLTSHSSFPDGLFAIANPTIDRVQIIVNSDRIPSTSQIAYLIVGII